MCVYICVHTVYMYIINICCAVSTYMLTDQFNLLNSIELHKVCTYIHTYACIQRLIKLFPYFKARYDTNLNIYNK